MDPCSQRHFSNSIIPTQSKTTENWNQPPHYQNIPHYIPDHWSLAPDCFWRGECLSSQLLESHLCSPLLTQWSSRDLGAVSPHTQPTLSTSLTIRVLDLIAAGELTGFTVGGPVFQTLDHEEKSHVPLSYQTLESLEYPPHTFNHLPLCLWLPNPWSWLNMERRPKSSIINYHRHGPNCSRRKSPHKSKTILAQIGGSEKPKSQVAPHLQP